MTIIKIAIAIFSILWFLITLRLDAPKKQKIFVGISMGLLVFFFLIFPIIKALTAEEEPTIIPTFEYADTAGIPQFYKSLSIWVGMRPLVYENVDFSSPRLLQPFRNLDSAIDYPIIIEIDATGQLLVSCVIRSLDGKISGEIIDNEFVDNPDGYFDRNYSKGTVEVIGKKGIPVLQISFDTKDVMEIYGVFYFLKEGKTMLAFLGDGCHIVGDYRVVQEKVEELSIGRIFEYPSAEKIGVLNPKRPIRSI
ncbi:MAG: hypothetical protein ACP5G4_00490 [bacterium]